MAENTPFSLLLVLEKILEWSVMWRPFLSFKELFKQWTKVTSISRYSYFWIVYPLSRITLDVNSTIFVSQNLTLALYVDCDYEFTSGRMIPYLTHWSNSHIDVCFIQILWNSLRSSCWCIVFQWIRLLKNIFPVSILQLDISLTYLAI